MRRLTLAATAVTVLLVPTALAAAKPVHNTLSTARSATLGQTIVVDSHGKTAYRLDPETASRLLCTSSSCLSFWHPITVASKAKLHAARGVKGKLGVLHRAHGVLQVTLRGLPLYTFAPETSGKTTGEGIQSFGGTWKALSAASGTGIAPPSQSSSGGSAGSPGSGTSPGTGTSPAPGTSPGYTPPYVVPGY
jgi:predicted lipoprotein with Yx(FWY)xxD motif